MCKFHYIAAYTHTNTIIPHSHHHHHHHLRKKKWKCSRHSLSLTHVVNVIFSVRSVTSCDWHSLPFFKRVAGACFLCTVCNVSCTLLLVIFVVVIFLGWINSYYTHFLHWERAMIIKLNNKKDVSSAAIIIIAMHIYSYSKVSTTTCV